MLPITEINLPKLLQVSIIDNPFNDLYEFTNIMMKYCDTLQTNSSFQIKINDYEIMKINNQIDPELLKIRNIASIYMKRANIRIDESICTIIFNSYYINNNQIDNNLIDNKNIDDKLNNYCVETCVICINKDKTINGFNFIYWIDISCCLCSTIQVDNILSIKQGEVLLFNGNLQKSYTKYIGYGNIKLITIHFKSLERGK